MVNPKLGYRKWNLLVQIRMSITRIFYPENNISGGSAFQLMVKFGVLIGLFDHHFPKMHIASTIEFMWFKTYNKTEPRIQEMDSTTSQPGYSLGLWIIKNLFIKLMLILIHLFCFLHVVVVIWSRQMHYIEIVLPFYHDLFCKAEGPWSTSRN